MSDRSFADALKENIEQITSSAVFCQIHNESMADFEKDPWPAIQLAIAILADKPIIIFCLPDRVVPPRLARLADEIVYGGPEEWTAAVKRRVG